MKQLELELKFFEERYFCQDVSYNSTIYKRDHMGGTNRLTEVGTIPSTDYAKSLCKLLNEGKISPRKVAEISRWQQEEKVEILESKFMIMIEILL